MNKEIIGNILALVIIAAVVIALVIWLPRVLLAIVALMQLATLIAISPQLNSKLKQDGNDDREA